MSHLAAWLCTLFDDQARKRHIVFVTKRGHCFDFVRRRVEITPALGAYVAADLHNMTEAFRKPETGSTARLRGLEEFR